MGQPTEGALLSAAMKHGMYNVADRYVRLQEYPFSSEQKMMAVRCSSKYDKDKDEIYFVKGAIEKILPKCTRYSWNGNEQQMTPNKEQEFIAEAHEVAKKGLRVISMAKGTSLQDLIFSVLSAYVILLDQWYEKPLVFLRKQGSRSKW